MKLLLPLFCMFLIISCGETSDEVKTLYGTCSVDKEQSGECVRYMDRTIYFGNYVAGDEGINDVFAVQKIKDAIREVESGSELGSGYFSFQNVDANLLTPYTERVDGLTWRSFILVWNDTKFNEFLQEVEYQADPNVIIMINKANRKQFWMIVRGSCFDSGNSNCTNDIDTNFTSSSGLVALVARSIGRLVAMNIETCDDNSGSVMCAEYPSDAQWSELNSNSFYSSFRNALDAIDDNEDFYKVFELEQ